VSNGTSTSGKKVTFIQFAEPPLKADTYTITAEQTLNTAAPNDFKATTTFIVQGERFAIKAEEINGVFPPNLANGEFDGVLPHVALNRRTLPWERNADPSTIAAPWLAVLLLTDDEATAVTQATGYDLVRQVTAKDLIPLGATITVEDSTLTGTGALPAGYLSYPCFNPLEYGQSPDDPCLVLDLPLDVFNRIAPSKNDLPYLAHIREVDTTDANDSTGDSTVYAIVQGNRLPKPDVASHAFLVGLEEFASYLPGDDGTASSQIPAGTTYVRLIAYTYWRYTANTLDEAFKALLESLNKTAGGQPALTTIQLPCPGTPPTADQVAAALTRQVSGQLISGDAQILVENALTMGYVPLNHHLRHGGQTVSWYRGPLVPYPVATTLSVPLADADAANAYNPQTGLFDVSYGAAWQVGQLLALQNTSFASTLYNWKRTTRQQDAMDVEAQLLGQKMDGVPILGDFFASRSARLANAQVNAVSAPPDEVVTWLARLGLLNGVPFSYLVPDERMLPPESLRFFYLDLNWVDALVDGAFSIGRDTAAQLQADARPMPTIRSQVIGRARAFRARATRVSNYANNAGQVTGFLLRSKVVAGWPNLQANGYADIQGTMEIQKLRFAQLAKDVMICLFDGVVQMVALHEPPDQLHAGVEGNAGHYTTTLRGVQGSAPGQQLSGSAAVPTRRSDPQTIWIAQASTNVLTALNAPPFSQQLTVFTSAEFALEMIKGAVKVEFQQTA